MSEVFAALVGGLIAIVASLMHMKIQRQNELLTLLSKAIADWISAAQMVDAVLDREVLKVAISRLHDANTAIDLLGSGLVNVNHVSMLTHEVISIAEYKLEEVRIAGLQQNSGTQSAFSVFVKDNTKKEQLKVISECCIDMKQMHTELMRQSWVNKMHNVEYDQ